MKTADIQAAISKAEIQVERCSSLDRRRSSRRKNLTERNSRKTFHFDKGL